MTTTIELGNIPVNVVKKNIKNIHLSVYPPTGEVRISAPLWMKLETIRVFAISKVSWIKKQQNKFLEQKRETPREYLNRESHYLWGKRYLLEVHESNAPARVELNHSTIKLHVRPGTNEDKKRAIVDDWYREQLRQAIPSPLAKWEPIIGMSITRLYVQKMKTRWGTCNPRAKSIRLNSDLAKKPIDCLEYVLVHEMVHFLERTHNNQFISLMDRFMPQWRHLRQALNCAPLSHMTWGY